MQDSGGLIDQLFHPTLVCHIHLDNYLIINPFHEFYYKHKFILLTTIIY
jgi:hypothetical protein